MAGKTLLFMIADTGAGHRSAANAISNAIQQICPDSSYRIEIIDIFATCGHPALRPWVKMYGPAIKHTPHLYGSVYKLTNHHYSFSNIERMARPFVRQGLARLLLTIKPDVIVSIHPLLNHMTLRILEKIDLPVPFLTVITDLFSLHTGWMSPGVDACVAPTDKARELCIGSGIPAERVHMLGMPIDPKFMRLLGTKEELRARLQLAPTIFTVLMVGGGEGAGLLLPNVLAISKARLPVQLIVVSGRNQRLYAQLQRRQEWFSVPVKVLGFVNNMPELMKAADIIVTKAGPGTITEALSCDLPVILTGGVPGQEEGNIEYVLQTEVGKLAQTPRRLVQLLRRLCAVNSSELARLRAKVAKIGRPQASLDIARLILEFSAYQGEPARYELWREHAPRTVQPLPSLLQTTPFRPSRVRTLSGLLKSKVLVRTGIPLNQLQRWRASRQRRIDDAWTKTGGPLNRG